MAPSKSVRNPQTGEIEINYSAYKREITGLTKAFWQMVFELKSYKEVAEMDMDTFIEGYCALKVLNENQEKEGNGGHNFPKI